MHPHFFPFHIPLLNVIISLLSVKEKEKEVVTSIFLLFCMERAHVPWCYFQRAWLVFFWFGFLGFLVKRNQSHCSYYLDTWKLDLGSFFFSSPLCFFPFLYFLKHIRSAQKVFSRILWAVVHLTNPVWGHYSGALQFQGLATKPQKGSTLAVKQLIVEAEGLGTCAFLFLWYLKVRTFLVIFTCASHGKISLFFSFGIIFFFLISSCLGLWLLV